MSKIGRNDNCPCGSGRKYKKCCMNEIPTEKLDPEKLREIKKIFEEKEKLNVEPQLNLVPSILVGGKRIRIL